MFHDEIYAKERPVPDQVILFKRWLIMIFAVLISMISTYVASFLLARILGPSNYGRYSALNSLTQFLVSPCAYGAYTGIIRFMPTYFHQEKWSLCRGLVFFYIQKITKISLITLISWIFSFILIQIFNPKFDFIHQNPLYWGILILPVCGFSYFLEGLVNSTRYINVSEFIWGALYPLLIVLVAVFTQKYVGLESHFSLAFIIMMATILASLILLPIIYKSIPQIFCLSPVSYQKDLWSNVSKNFILINVSVKSLDYLPIIIMHLIWNNQNSRMVGLYAVLLLLTNLVSTAIPNGIAAIMAPIIHPLIKQKKVAKIQSILNKIIILRFSCVLLLALMAIYFKEPILKHFGDYYLEHGQKAYFFIIFIGVLTSPFSYTFNIFKYSGESAKLLKVLYRLTFVTIILDYIMIKYLGLEGGILCFLLNRLPSYLVCFYYLKKELRIKPLILF